MCSAARQQILSCTTTTQPGFDAMQLQVCRQALRRWDAHMLCKAGTGTACSETQSACKPCILHPSLISHSRNMPEALSRCCCMSVLSQDAARSRYNMKIQCRTAGTGGGWSLRAATPGSTRPSSSSSAAPPPVLMWLMRSCSTVIIK